MGDAEELGVRGVCAQKLIIPLVDDDQHDPILLQ